MKFCPNCGTKIDEGVKFCPSCGKEANSETSNKTADNFTKVINSLNNNTDHTEEFDEQDVNQNKTIALFSYLGILFLIPLLGAQGSKYARFHVNQGLLLFLFSMALGIVNNILTFIAEFLPILYLFNLAYILVLALAMIGIFNAISGKAKELPVIGKFKIIT